jgi:hypothetical protein
MNGKCFILVSNTLLHKPFEHKIKSASAWLCGSSESKGVAILLSKHFAFDINLNFSEKIGRLLTYEINTENAVFHIFNIYALNLCRDRKHFFRFFSKHFLQP